MHCLSRLFSADFSLIFFILDYSLYVVCGLCLISGEEQGISALYFDRISMSRSEEISSKCRYCRLIIRSQFIDLEVVKCDREQWSKNENKIICKIKSETAHTHVRRDPLCSGVCWSLFVVSTIFMCGPTNSTFFIVIVHLPSKAATRV